MAPLGIDLGISQTLSWDNNGLKNQDPLDSFMKPFILGEEPLISALNGVMRYICFSVKHFLVNMHNHTHQSPSEYHLPGLCTRGPSASLRPQHCDFFSPSTTYRNYCLLAHVHFLRPSTRVDRQELVWSGWISIKVDPSLSFSLHCKNLQGNLWENCCGCHHSICVFPSIVLLYSNLSVSMA